MDAGTHDASRGASRAGMPGMPWRATLPAAAAIILGFGVLAAIRYVTRPLALLVLAVALAEALSPLVARLQRRMPRGVAVGITFGTLAVVIVALSWLIVPTLVAQIQSLVANAPAFAERARVWIQQQNGALGLQVSSIFSALPSHLGELLVALPLRVAHTLIEVFVVAFLAVYWLIGTPALEAFVLSLLPAERRPGTRSVLRDMGQAMGGYVRGTAINAAIMGVLAWIGLELIGVPYALMLGTLTMMCEPVPFLGPILAAIPVTLIAFAVSPTMALLALGLYTLLQQIEGHLLTPNIMRRQTDVPQTLVIFALLAGGALGGILGVLASIPLAAAAHVLVLRVVAPAVRRATGAPPAPDGR